MPPRRSSRVASASLETAPIEPSQSKRKRGQTIEPDNEEKENVAKPPSRARRSVSARPSVPPPSKKRKTRSPTRKTQVATVIEDSDEDIEAPPSAQPPNGFIDEVHSVAPTTPPVVEEEEEEEEKSLFDPPPMPGPSSLPQAVPEEPTGPRSRLVIHKMALINFKSYAGRQEIGPFHKVTNIRQALVTLTDLFNARSHFPLSLVPMGLENLILSMLSYSYSDTVLPR